MKLLLGKHDVITAYVENVLNLDCDLDVLCCPAVNTHHTEFGSYIDIIKKENPPVITTQSLEMLDVLLKSNLQFEIITVRRYDDEIRAATRTKDYVVDCRKAWNFDPRN
jgi:hypothetical protein